MSYAQATSVPENRTRNDIEDILAQYGADQFIYGWGGNDAVVGFRKNGKMVRFKLAMPTGNEESLKYTPTGRLRRDGSMDTRIAQERRRRWRALLLVIKAKLEAVDTGISSFEEEFLSWILLPDGSNVAEFMLPQIDQAYKSGKMPKLLPA